jgi:prophage DNA circulation protein
MLVLDIIENSHHLSALRLSFQYDHPPIEQNVLEKYKQRLPLIEATAAASDTTAVANTSRPTTASQDHAAAPTTLSDRDALKKNLVVEMKSVTGADESVCVSLLESHSFDLKTSIETFFAEGSLREIPD